MEQVEKRVNPYIVALIIILPTFWAMVATSASNVCLPYIAGYYGSTQNEAKTVITSYMIANAILLPMTGLLIRKFGITKLLNLCIIIFTIGSLVCTIAPNLLTLIIGRIIQGVGGGALMPLCQAVLFNIFSYEKRGTAMGLFGLAVIMPPLIGPFIGGYFTDNFCWQASFFVNIPFCILALFLNKLFLPNWKPSDTSIINFDWLGLILLTIWLASMQIILEKGEQYNWLDNEWICFGVFVCIVSMVAFYIWELECKKPLVDVRVFKDINFSIGTLIGAMVCFSIYGTLFLVPLFVQGLLGYSATLSGAVTLPRMFASLFGLIIVGKLADYINNKVLLSIGIILLAVSTAMCMNYNLNLSMFAISLPHYLFGLGIAFAFVPLSTLSFSTLSSDKIAEATGPHALLKCISNALAIAWAATFILRHSQINQTYNLDNLSANNLILQGKLTTLQNIASVKLPTMLAAKKATATIYNILIQQSQLQSFFQAFWFLVCFAIIILPLVFLLKTNKIEHN